MLSHQTLPVAQSRAPNDAGQFLIRSAYWTTAHTGLLAAQNKHSVATAQESEVAVERDEVKS